MPILCSRCCAISSAARHPFVGERSQLIALIGYAGLLFYHINTTFINKTFFQPRKPDDDALPSPQPFTILHIIRITITVPS